MYSEEIIFDTINKAVTRCYNGALVWTIFATRVAFRSIHNDVLLSSNKEI